MIIIKKYYRYILLSIPLISLLLHLHVFKLDLVGIHVWRQTQTQTVVDNFYQDDLNIFHPKINDRADTDRIIKMEFPIMQWLFALFYKLFGNHIMISRVLSFIIGLGSVYGMFSLCRNIFNNTVIATIGAWAFNFSPVFYYYTLNPLPDNFALCCAIWSMAFFYKYGNTPKIKYIIFSALLLSVATLAKLPFILYGSVVLTYLVLQLRSGKYKSQLSQIACIYLIAMIPAMLWYISVVPTWNNTGIVAGMLHNKESIATILGYFQFHLVSTLPELLINYGSVLFFLGGFYFLVKKKVFRKPQFPVFLIWGISILLYFIFEINMIENIHDYYLLPFLPLIFLLVAYGGYHLLAVPNKFLKYLSVIALLALPLTAYLRANTRWNTEQPGFNSVYYRYKEQLRGLTPPDARCIIGNDESHFILLYYIDRKGWCFSNDDLTEQQLSYYMAQGAKYLFTDSPIDKQDGIKTHLGQKIFEQDDVRVYTLK